MNRNDDVVVTASEIAAWAWCPESWRLGALGLEPGNRASLERGEKHHRKKAAFEVLSRLLIRVGVSVLLFAIVLGLIAFLFRSVPE